MSNITLEQAQRVLAAAEAKAVETGVPSSISILDTGARLVALLRQDGAPLVSIDSSVAKARTSVFFGGAATGDLVGAIQPGAPLFTLGDATPEQLTFLAGGLPLRDADGVLIGAIGSGGGTPEQDAVIAEAGVASL
ncbi:heme-binding protein [Labedella phragmitis]|uniref:Heme-binding protein n=2 Tax=Labedella TaxID=390250 RepID=A0A444Q3X5_9MICO|nr:MULTISPECIES: heme-binding protein [Labedella]RWZ46182.1 heme-binding protein [Labedella phragmitis]RWZ58508.1 heme-binding protein [Labedella populi]